MLIRLTADRALKSGRIARKGEFVDLPDDEAYPIVWAGDAVPPVRLRYICEMGFVGTRNVARGDLVDMPAETYDPMRFYHLVAVVPVAQLDRYVGTENLSYPAGQPILVPQPLAVEMVMAGGRYATQDEANALDWVAPTKDPAAWPSLPLDTPAGRKAAALAALKEAGPVKRVHIIRGVECESESGAVILFEPGEIVEVPVSLADTFIQARKAEPLVKARVAFDGLLVGNLSCMKGDVVEVGETMAEDADRFEPLDGPVAPKGKPAPANRFGS